ncbi:MAG: ATP-dependent DNA helicase RecQ [Saprospiraceae bacterium]|nr:MAG: ATP-dependent DNA helicase RecQ [Saprospiraceae bacterium]
MNLDLARNALKKYFGYDHFRPMQAEIIQAIYDKKNCLVLMPTGGGKSICFQIPAVTLEGACVVVSPLISLMKDQVEGLRVNGIRASFLNSSLSSEEQQQVENDFFSGEIDLLYVSPEKLVSQGFIPLLKRVKLNLFAIDEAHCISAWGHDFRPEYTKMKFLKKEFPDVPIVALTATADKLTRRDIINQLHFQQPEIFVASFDRPNLSLEVRPGQRRLEQIKKFVGQRPDQPGIIYCLSRKSTENLAAKLNDAGFNAACYHAGLRDTERSEVQEGFIKDNVNIICATIAFGMGIDKSNVRWVIHYNLPKNIEGYYQEIGRSGRDGARAETLLFYSFGDVSLLRDILTGNNSENQEIQLAKLERMRQYAESLACRRRVLLNYFGEDLNKNCGNCDICKNPPQYFDGTMLAQKAFSAVYRLREQVGVGLLIDVLRGSGKREIFEKKYHEIKTYGQGRDLPFVDWRHYIAQMTNLGYLEIAHDQKNVLKLTPASHRVLFKNEKVQLFKMATLKERQQTEKAKAKPVTHRQRSRNELFEELRQLRKKLAQQKGVPPYIIFSDASLEEMAVNQPMNDVAMRKISGVGERKLQLYGDFFMEAIREYVKFNTNSFSSDILDITYEFYREKLSIAEIARERNLTESIISKHLSALMLRGKDIDIFRFISEPEAKQVWKAIRYLDKPYKVKSIYELLKGSISYDKIHLALTYHELTGVK